MTLRIVAAVVLALGAVMAVRSWNAHLVAVGDAQGAQRVRTQWETADAKRRADELQAGADAAQERARAEFAARELEQAKQIQAERIAREQAQREGALRASLGRADARQRSLLDTIDQLNEQLGAQRAPGGDGVPGTGPGADTTAIVDAARTARELLGGCIRRYAAVAAAADQLSAQVTGLQDFVRTVVPTTMEPVSP